MRWRSSTAALATAVSLTAIVATDAPSVHVSGGAVCVGCSELVARFGCRAVGDLRISCPAHCLTGTTSDSIGEVVLQRVSRALQKPEQLPGTIRRRSQAGNAIAPGSMGAVGISSRVDGIGGSWAGSWDDRPRSGGTIEGQLVDDRSTFSVTGLMLRSVPIAMALFVTLFGSKVSSMIRAGTVFVSSCIPLLVPVIQKIKADKKLSVETFLGIAGALYAGGLGCFASVKNRNFGMMAQGISLGYVLASVLEAFVADWILSQAPQAEPFMEWITMAFSFQVGVMIGKASIKFESVINVVATAVIGAYAQMQMFVSLGFPFVQSLSPVSEQKGCDNWGCQIVVLSFLYYGLCGVWNQVKMERVMKLMEENPEFEGD